MVASNKSGARDPKSVENATIPIVRQDDKSNVVTCRCRVASCRQVALPSVLFSQQSMTDIGAVAGTNPGF
jgi:hypothetical protein